MTDELINYLDSSIDSCEHGIARVSREFLIRARALLSATQPAAVDREATKPNDDYEVDHGTHIERVPFYNPDAAPSVEQDERGAVMIQGRFVLEADPDFPDLPTYSVWSEIPTKESADRLKAKYGNKIELRELVARAASTSATNPAVTFEELASRFKLEEKLSDVGAFGYDRTMMRDLARDFFNACTHAASTSANVAQGAEPYYRWVGGLCFMYWENKDGELQCKQIDAAPAQVALTDAQIDAVIEESDGYWCDDEFRINGKDLMNLCRALTAAQSASGDAK